MVDINSELWRTVEPLLDHALELSTGERAAWLLNLDAEMPEEAAEVRALLASEEEADRDGFLKERVKLPVPVERATLLSGRRIGDYTIDRLIGRGGMGTVWLARRADGRYEGKVAIKLLNLSLMSDVGRERFRREGSVLARLAHFGVAKLLDAGVADDGQPYLVLEYVDGQPIDVYADTRSLGVRERIQLVHQVLSAVDHAHARLIIHRDIKPTNILVGADGASKLLDFGIAKLLDDNNTTALTSEGAHLLTPDYASPEQLCGDTVTTASDVYAIGVLLFQLLTGGTPFVTGQNSLPEFARIVCGGNPVIPSTRWKTKSRTLVALRELAAQRGSTPERLQRELDGDLDAIVLKAMHVDPTRRYQTANALSDDLQRYLDGRPVNARADSIGYRTRKFVRRHRLVVGLSLLGAFVLSGAVIRERALRSKAEAETRKAKAVEQYLVSVFDVADPYAPTSESGEMTARQLLDRGAARIDSVLRDQPDVQGELRGSLGRVYSNLGLYSDAVPLLRQSHDQLLRLHGPQHLTVATAKDRLGLALMETNAFAESETLLRDALATRRSLLGDVQVETAESIDHLATLLQQRGNLAAADSLFREALLVQRLVHGTDHVDIANGLNNLALLLYVRGEYDQAEPYYREALALDRKLLGDNHPLTAQVLHNLAQLQQQRGQYEDAEDLYRRALNAKRKTLGNRHPSVTINLNNLGLMLAQNMNRPREGAVMIREALALDRSMFGDHHSFVAEGMRNLAVVLRLDGDFKASETLLRKTLVINRTLFGPEHVRVALNLYHLGLTLHLEGNVRDALPLYRESAQLYTRLGGDKDGRTNTVLIDYARALVERGELTEAESLFRRALSTTDTTSKLQRTQWIGSLTGLGGVLVLRGQHARAQTLLLHAVSLAEEKFGNQHWRTADAKLALSRSYLAAGATERARDMLNQAAGAAERFERAQPGLVMRIAKARQELNAHQHAWALSR